MEVIVKNNQISKTHISKMAYNHVNNVLACNIDGNDTILFYSLHAQSMTFIELFKGMSKPPGSKISMNWSPDGRYLALGAGNIQLWQLKQGKLKPVKSYQQDFIEIKIIQWSIDSLSYACGGISRTNTIRIRNIQTNKTKQLQLPDGQTISAISFDPYGKYLLLLLRNNTIQIYSVLNYERYKTVRLSPEGIKVNPIKEVRVPSWSPDFSNFICPSLDDSRINIAINLSRSKDFKTKNIFMGHCTSISCCQFNPKLYRWKGQVTAIVAMGDSAGNVSFWRVGNKNDYPEPLLLSNSLQNSMQVVEDIQWDQKGQILMVNMMKKYVHMIKFVNKEKYFGQQLTNDQTFSLIKQIYGSNRATDVNKREIQVFDLNFSGWNSNIAQEEKKLDESVNKQNGSTIKQQKNQTNILVGSKKQSLFNQPVNFKPNTQMQVQETIKFNNIPLNSNIQIERMNSQPEKTPTILPRPIPQSIPIPITSSTNEYVKVCEQKIIIGKNNKKKIQPAMMVRKDEIITANIKQPLNTSYNFGLPSNTTLFSNSMVQTFQSLQLPHIIFTDKQLTLNKQKILEIKRLNKVTSLEIMDLFQDNNEPIARRIFPMMVDYIHISDKLIYVLNQQFLYVFDFELNPKELPLKVGHIHMFLANDFGDIYLINCDGYLIGFNHLQNINKTIAPAPLHFLLRQDFNNQPNQNAKLTIKQFLLTKTSDILITVQTEKANNKIKRQRYMYDVRKNGWVKLEFKQGILEPGFSIRITDTEQNMIKNFFTSLCPTLRQKSLKTYQLPGQLKRATIISQSVISPQQQELIYYSKYQNDKEKYCNSLIEYFKSLKTTNKNKQLRTCLNRYFFDDKSANYLHNNQQRQKLWLRVKNQIGGNIIEEFQIGFTHQCMIQQQ